MTAFGTVEDPTLVTTLFIESSDPDDLQAQINAALAAIDGNTTVVSALSVAGAGDGFPFVALIDVTPISNASGGLIVGQAGNVPIALVRCYLAGSAGELDAARARAGIPAPITSGPAAVPYALVDDQLAGASQGSRFLGLSIYELGSIPVGIAALVYGSAVSVNQSLIQGANLISFSALGPNVLGYTLPTPPVLRDGGAASHTVEVEASATVEQTGAGDVSVTLVQDPNGAATALNSITTHVGAGGFDNVSVFGFAQVIAPVEATRQFGLIVTAAGAGTLRSAILAAHKI